MSPDDFLGSCHELWGLHEEVWVCLSELDLGGDVATLPNRKWPTNLDLTLKPVTSPISMSDLFREQIKGSQKTIKNHSSHSWVVNSQ